MKTVLMKITGTEPLLVNNPQMSNPLHPLVRELSNLTGKRKKSEEDLREILRLKWLGSLYHAKDIGPYLPADCLFKSLLEAARLTKEGKLIERGGLLMAEQRFPILYEGPREPEAMYAHDSGRFVDIRSGKPPGQGRIMTSRAIFPDWKLDASFIHDPEMLDFAALQRIASTAGLRIGVGTYRLRFGRFQAKCSIGAEKLAA